MGMRAKDIVHSSRGLNGNNLTSGNQAATITHPSEPAIKHSLTDPRVRVLEQGLRDSFGATAFQEMLDRSFHAGLSKITAGLSPAALLEAYLGWLIHLGLSPGKQLKLVEKAIRKSMRLTTFALQSGTDDRARPPCIDPLPQDKRFRSVEWQRWPFNIYYQQFLLTQQWWSVATTGVRGVSCEKEKVIEFASRQILDVFSPSNYILTNPEILDRTVHEGGANLVRGAMHFFEDWERWLACKKPVGAERFAVGKDVAVTPGKVIYRNELIELIQYEPATEKVHPEPILIVPAWIMKYYILDLSPDNSFVRYLVEQGFTVFMISWRNPGPEHRDFGMKDYRLEGIEAALQAVGTIVPNRDVHAVGYCLGGTLLAIVAAAMARDNRNNLKTVSLLAAQTDFNEPGELELFINESQLAFLEDLMWEQGFLESTQMSGTFQLMRSNDLIWSRIVREYLMGERLQINDLMAWNADSTRMPYKMHSQYLRWLYLNNDLAEGRYRVGDRPIALADIRAPIFSLGTQSDHVAPWRSVYKIHLLTDTEVTFLLTTGGHNAGVVSEPGHPRRSYQMSTRSADEQYLDPENWLLDSAVEPGSWWPAWAKWLHEHSSPHVNPPHMGVEETAYTPLCDAPGHYVLAT